MVTQDMAAKMLLARHAVDVPGWLFAAPLRRDLSSTYGTMSSGGSHTFQAVQGVQCVSMATDGYLYADSGADAPSDAFTLCSWVQSDLSVSLRKRFLCVCGASLSNTVWFDQNSDGKIRANNAGGTLSANLSTPSSVDCRAWRHIAATLADGYLRIYVDGAMAAEAGVTITGTLDLRLAYVNAIASATTNRVSVRYHDARVYPRALSSGDLLRVMEATK